MDKCTICRFLIIKIYRIDVADLFMTIPVREVTHSIPNKKGMMPWA